jgi:hypothetical protein
LDYAFKYLEKHAAGNPLITAPPAPGLKYIVTIPAYLETDLIKTLLSLYTCIPPEQVIEVIIVINWPEDESLENIRLSRGTTRNVNEWINNHHAEWITFHVVELPGIPVKKAGVGFARKAAMDEAVRRFIISGREDGIIISFDADTACDKNFFTSIESHFSGHPLTDGCSIYFEHPLEGDEFEEVIYHGICLYELHLRYYLHSIRLSGFPNAYYTLGSSFAVRACTYCLQGGMNTRKAGEDFYFLQKIFDLGSFSELNSTRVIPSPRPSLRVPFGTGASMVNYLNNNQNQLSFNSHSFSSLGKLFAAIPQLYKADQLKSNDIISRLDISIRSYLRSVEFGAVLDEINENSSGYTHFRKRFFRYFNMFRILKYLNHAKQFHPDIPVTEGAASLLRKTGINISMEEDPKLLLRYFRAKDRNPILQRK